MLDRSEVVLVPLMRGQAFKLASLARADAKKRRRRITNKGFVPELGRVNMDEKVADFLEDAALRLVNTAQSEGALRPEP